MKRKLSENVKIITQSFVNGSAKILGTKLHGIYMYGATIFTYSGPIQDIDCHVVLNKHLKDNEIKDIKEMHRTIATKYPPLGGSLDAYFILFEAAQAKSPPQHQLNKEIFDTAWALHCAHVRAGRYETLWGPEPKEIFPTPSWHDIDVDLMNQLKYIKEHLCYSAYCILNLCRIMYSYTKKDVVVSKHFCANWGVKKLPQWKPLIAAAMRYYNEMRYYTKAINYKDDKLFAAQLNDFLSFSEDYINKIKNEETE